ncbi:unnamed protein product, partial [Pylaiella littoralis]
RSPIPWVRPQGRHGRHFLCCDTFCFSRQTCVLCSSLFTNGVEDRSEIRLRQAVSNDLVVSRFCCFLPIKLSTGPTSSSTPPCIFVRQLTRTGSRFFVLVNPPCLSAFFVREVWSRELCMRLCRFARAALRYPLCFCWHRWLTRMHASACHQRYATGRPVCG